MDGIQPWMRLKVNADTFFLPDADGSVYFRNNVGSFRVEGAAVAAWMENLLPVFDGQQTLTSITDGLPIPYQNRIYDIAGILYNNGFVRDVSTDEPHQLSDKVLAYFAPQIEFVDNLIGSGAYRFQRYRNSKILTIGSGRMAASLVGLLLESGLSTVNVVMADEDSTETARFKAFLDSYEHLDEPVAVNQLTNSVVIADGFADLIQSMDAVVYVSQTGDIDELSRIESICQHKQTLFIPAIFVKHVGLVGPTVCPEENGLCFDSAWRRVHETVFESDLHVSGVTDTSIALLANVVAFELFKSITGIASSPRHRFYTLNVETLEGKWHEFIPGFDVGWSERVQQIQDLGGRVSTVSGNEHDVLSFFSQITDKTAGIFHVWDEGNLSQLPLSQCRVQPVNPVSTGPATLLPEILCTGLTHEAARCEAGLSGIEAYVRRFVGLSPFEEEIVGIGAGRTMTESVGRGLTDFLSRELQQAVESQQPTIQVIELGDVEDESCHFYLRALRATGIEPVVGRSDNLMGCPVVWVGTNDGFVGSVGFTFGMALQRALAYVLLLESQGQRATDTTDREQTGKCVFVRSAQVEDDECTLHIDIAAWNGYDNTQITTVIEALTQSGKEIRVWDWAVEAFLREGLGGVIGISALQEGFE